MGEKRHFFPQFQYICMSISYFNKINIIPPHSWYLAIHWEAVQHIDSYVSNLCLLSTCIWRERSVSYYLKCHFTPLQERWWPRTTNTWVDHNYWKVWYRHINIGLLWIVLTIKEIKVTRVKQRGKIIKRVMKNKFKGGENQKKSNELAGLRDQKIRNLNRIRE